VLTDEYYASLIDICGTDPVYDVSYLDIATDFTCSPIYGIPKEAEDINSSDVLSTLFSNFDVYIFDKDPDKTPEIQQYAWYYCPNGTWAEPQTDNYVGDCRTTIINAKGEPEVVEVPPTQTFDPKYVDDDPEVARGERQQKGAGGDEEKYWLPLYTYNEKCAKRPVMLGVKTEDGKYDAGNFCTYAGSTKTLALVHATTPSITLAASASTRRYADNLLYALFLIDNQIQEDLDGDGLGLLSYETLEYARINGITHFISDDESSPMYIAGYLDNLEEFDNPYIANETNTTTYPDYYTNYNFAYDDFGEWEDITIPTINSVQSFVASTKNTANIINIPSMFLEGILYTPTRNRNYAV
jgi:hypothetical protein